MNIRKYFYLTSSLMMILTILIPRTVIISAPHTLTDSALPFTGHTIAN
jgi:hypothetical protein